MRVTSQTLTNSLVDQIQRLSQRQVQLQREAATGQRLETPADDPAAMRRLLASQSEVKAAQQHQANIAVLSDHALANQQALKNLKSLSDRASEIATAADSTKSTEDLRAYAIEVNQLLEEAVQIANRKHQNDYLFGGTKNDAAPFTATKNAAADITAVTYQGNTQIPEVDIGFAERMTALLPGANTGNSGASGVLVDQRAGADFLQHLVALRDHLHAGEVAAISSQDRPALGRDEENLLGHLSANSARQARLQAAAALAANRQETAATTVSRLADADLTQTLVQLNATQVAFQAALQAGASLLRQNLLDYLR